MAALKQFLLTTLTILLLTKTTLSAKESKKFFKGMEAPYGIPMSVCIPEFIGLGYLSTMITCESGNNGNGKGNGNGRGRNSKITHYSTSDCSGAVDDTDEFTASDTSYYFNCVEDEDGDDDEFENQYVIGTIREGLEETISMEINGTIYNETICGPVNETGPFRTMAAITNQCTSGWSLGEPRWYYWTCTNTSIRVDVFEESDCGGFLVDNETNVTAVDTIYYGEGCVGFGNNYLNKKWYTEIINCTHPVVINMAVINGNNMMIVILTIFSMLINMV
eukprot:509554_1